MESDIIKVGRVKFAVKEIRYNNETIKTPADINNKNCE